MEGGDRVAAGALPVWVVLGGRGVVRPVAGARAGRGPGGMAGQGRDDLLRCHHGGKALAVGELGFCKPWVRRGLFKTLTPVPGDLAFSLGAACVTVEKGQKTSSGDPARTSYRQRLFVARHLVESSESAVDPARRAAYPWPEQMGRKLSR